MSLGEGRRGRVADGQAGAVGGDPVGVRHADAAGRAVPGEDHVAGRIDAAEVGDLAVVGGADVGVELQLLDDIGHPACAEAFPGEHGDRARAEQRPDRHLHRAGVGGRDDAEPVVGGKPKQRVRALDRLGEPRLAERRSVRPAERARVEKFERPARRLGAGTGGEMGRAWVARVGYRSVNVTLLAESTRRVGTAWPAAGCKRRLRRRQGGQRKLHVRWRKRRKLLRRYGAIVLIQRSPQ